MYCYKGRYCYSEILLYSIYSYVCNGYSYTGENLKSSLNCSYDNLSNLVVLQHLCRWCMLLLLCSIPVVVCCKLLMLQCIMVVFFFKFRIQSRKGMLYLEAYACSRALKKNMNSFAKNLTAGCLFYITSL